MKEPVASRMLFHDSVWRTKHKKSSYDFRNTPTMIFKTRARLQRKKQVRQALFEMGEHSHLMKKQTYLLSKKSSFLKRETDHKDWLLVGSG
mmetsp:Transcript_16927/g.26056  ORF Transcript_16927/g.26056 Transcript_16927/m.26056 type:complete len:91 (+) Transcript_16927:1037-1309(+)